MVELKDIAQENEVDLENCVVFVMQELGKEVMTQWVLLFHSLQNKL